MFPSFKIVLVGDSQVGKTTWIYRNMEDKFNDKYSASVGRSINQLVFQTNRGPICFQVWDIAGDERRCGLREGYYHGADGALVMFDVTNKTSFNTVERWHRNITTFCGDLPVVTLGNKVDLVDRKVKLKDLKIFTPKRWRYFGTSAKSGYNLHSPFLFLARKLVNDPTLQFLSEEDLLSLHFNNNTHL